MKFEIKIPTSIEHITLEQYQKFASIGNDNDEDFVAYKMLEIFCDVPNTVASQMKWDEVQEICELINAVMNTKTAFKNRFELDGVEYGFVPSVEDMTFQEFLHMEEFVKDSKNYHKLAQIMYRPVTKKMGDLYDIERYEYSINRANALKKMPMNIFAETMVFFYDIAKELSIHFQVYLNSIQNQGTMQLANLLRNMVGLIPSTDYAVETSQDSNK